MRGFIVMAMFLATFANAGNRDFEEVRKLSVPVDDIDTLTIEAGAGSMDVTGVARLNSVDVTATIVVPDADEDEAARVMEKRMTLSLEASGNDARLDAWFDEGFFSFGSDAYIVLEVNVPQGMAVNIDDGAGSIDVIETRGNVTIDDGSGSIDVRGAANVSIDDGSGSIDVETAAGDVSIVDGSGSISVSDAKGSVTIDDGSGGIRVDSVERDLIIIADGSGGLSFSNIGGTVDTAN